MLKRSTQLYFLLLISFQSIAQVPSLKITGGQDSCVSLHTLKININVTGTIASTSMEMTFRNCSQRILEGTLTFPLPEGVSVSGYALDINGKMRDAVPVEKEKATQVFESIEKRRVDPGLLEKVEGNNFRTRIYPIPAGGSRTVRISYNEVLQPGVNNTLRYNLRLVYVHSIPNFHLAISVLQSATAPVMEEQPGDLQFKEWKKNYSASMDKKDFVPIGVLRFAVSRNSDAPEAVMQKLNNNYYFMTNVLIDNTSSRKRVLPKSIGIIWDASISGLKRDREAEYKLLENYFLRNPNCIVYLALLSNSFDSKGNFQITNSNWKLLRKALEAVVYDGGTNFSAIDLRSIPAEEYFLFSDGMSTLGSTNFSTINKKIFTINSSQSTDHSTLQLIARNSGASYLNLTMKSPEDALNNLMEEPFNFIGVKNNGIVAETYPSAFTPVNNGNFTMTGTSSLPVSTVTLQFGYGTTVTMEKTVGLNFSNQQITQVNLAQFWAEQKILELDLQYEKNKDDISYLGRQYSLVTRNTSLMVLETMEDYIRYKIEPPAEMRQEYFTRLKQQQNNESEESEEAYDTHAAFKELFSWWQPVIKNNLVTNKRTGPVIVAEASISNIDQPGIADTPPPVEANKAEDKKMLAEVVVTAHGQQRQARQLGYTTVTVKSEELKLEGKVAGLQVTNANSGFLNEVVVTGMNTRNKETVSITVSDWTPVRPYLSAMEKEQPVNYYSKYLDQRKEYISTPTFYFDMAGYFFRKKDRSTALRILSNIAELNIEDHELFVMLGYKLKEAGDFRSALFAFKKVLDWRPHEPQSYRLYGLALADAGQNQKAADILYKGLTRKYAVDIITNYQGIQDVMLMEFNNLLAKHTEIRTTHYNKKLITVMPVDIRVVLNWNRNDTDIDLWVTDPKGEKCYYGNQTSSNGALLSDDMTEGYGPEQLMVRKALKGKYKIEVHYFGDDQVKLTGPSTIMAEIFTRYNTGKEERKIIAIQMENNDQKNGVFIGEFMFE